MLLGSDAFLIRVDDETMIGLEKAEAVSAISTKPKKKRLRETLQQRETQEDEEEWDRCIGHSSQPRD